MQYKIFSKWQTPKTKKKQLIHKFKAGRSQIHWQNHNPYVTKQ